jgi:hypothetical protein
LHQILANELWIFGEEYQLGIDEQSLRSTLLKHIQLLGREQIVTDVEEVTDLEGRNRFLDLLLYRQYPQRREGFFEHLVIELKRPSLKLGKEEITQIEDYAFKVADDPRFDKVGTQWTFLLIGNDLDSFAQRKCESTGREYGHISAGRVNIHVRTWATLIAEAKWRYEFFRSQLEYQAKSDDGLAFLHRKHAKYFKAKADSVNGKPKRTGPKSTKSTSGTGKGGQKKTAK